MSDYKNITQVAKELVADHSNKKNDEKITADEVYVVWYSKTLKNAKLLLSTNVPDGRYYEVTYNGETDEVYFDSYVKEFNVALTQEGGF